MEKDEINRYLSQANFGNKHAIAKVYDYYFKNEEYEKGFLLLKRFEKDLDNELLRKLAACYIHGLGVLKSIDMGKEIYLRAYENGDTSSGYNLALIYVKEEDYSSALPLLSYGVYQNHKNSILLLAELYSNGLGVIKSRDIAISLYNKILESGDYLIYDKIGRLYYRDEEYFEAVKYFTLGANKLDPEAIYHLGVCYSKGQGVPQDIRKAVYYYELGASANHIKCMKNLILHYEKGVGVMINTKKADYYKKKIASLGG